MEMIQNNRIDCCFKHQMSIISEMYMMIKIIDGIVIIIVHLRNQMIVLKTPETIKEF